MRVFLKALTAIVLPLAVTAGRSGKSGTRRRNSAAQISDSYRQERAYQAYRMNVEGGIIAGFGGEKTRYETLNEPEIVQGDWATGVCHVQPEKVVEVLQFLQNEKALKHCPVADSRSDFWEGVSLEVVTRSYFSFAMKYLGLHRSTSSAVEFDKFLKKYPLNGYPFFEDPKSERVLPVNLFFTAIAGGVPIKGLFKFICERPDNDSLVRVYFNKEENYVELQYGLPMDGDEKSAILKGIERITEGCEMPFSNRKEAWECLVSLRARGFDPESMDDPELKTLIEGLIDGLDRRPADLVEGVRRVVQRSRKLLDESGKIFKPVIADDSLTVANKEAKYLTDYLEWTVRTVTQPDSPAPPPRRRGCTPLKAHTPEAARDRAAYFKLFDDPKELNKLFDDLHAKIIQLQEDHSKLSEPAKGERLEVFFDRLIGILNFVEKGAGFLWDEKYIDLVEYYRGNSRRNSGTRRKSSTSMTNSRSRSLTTSS